MKRLIFLFLIVVVVFAMYGCGGDGGTNTVNTNNVPVANAGVDQTSAVGNIVYLDGRGSFDVDGNALTYKWSIISVPGSSLTALSDSAVATPYFRVDVAGEYIVQLVVNDGTAASQPNTITIAVDSLALSYLSPSGGATGISIIPKLSWEFNGTNSPKYDVYFGNFNPPPLVLYQQAAKDFSPGTLSSGATYYWKVIGHNYSGTYSVATSVMSFTTTASTDSPPTADAGADQDVIVGATVTLNGTGTDPEGATLTYAWSIVNAPADNTATIVNATSATAYLTPNVVGAYVVGLTVNDGVNTSSQDTVIITVTATSTDSPPTADAGSDQSVTTGSTVTLDGSGSSDPEGSSLSYKWSFFSLPTGSAAILSGATTGKPSFTTDVAGAYTIRLIVNDGIQDSSPDMVEVIAAATPSTPLPLSSAQFWADGWGTRATWNESTGTVTVLQPGEPWQVNLSWSPIAITAGVAKIVSFSCVGGNTITVELKEDGGDYSLYASSIVDCDGNKTVTLTPTLTDSAAQLAIDFGKAEGTYTISDVNIQ